jgi:hypothetical protein
VVDAGGFSRGRLDNVRGLSRNELANASAVRGNVPVVPERQAQGAILRNIRTSASNGTPGDARRSTFSRAGVRQATNTRQASFDEQRQQVATSVRQIRTQDATSNRRATTATQPATRISPRVTGSVRSAGDVRSNSRANTATTRSGAVSPRGAQTYTAPDRRSRDSVQPRNNSVDRGGSVRGSPATTSAPQRSDSNTRSTDRGTLQQRNNSIDSGPVNRDSRTSRTPSAPARSESRVDRSSSSRSTPQVDRGSSSRVPRSVAPSSPARSSVPQIRSNPSPSPRVSRQPAPSSRIPRASSPSPRSSAPRVSSPAPRSSSPRVSSGGSSSPRSSGGGSRGGSSRGDRGSRR